MGDAASGAAARAPEVVAALRAQHSAALAQVEALGDKIKQLKLANGDKEAVKALGEELMELKMSLPVELLNEKDAKEWHKLAAKKAREDDKAARAAKWAPKEGKAPVKKAPVASAEVFVNTTPNGAKKDMSGAMAKAYNPPAVEAAWDAWWEAKGFYSCDVAAAKAARAEDKFIIVIPPPNVTGSLHIGHALTCSIEDVLCRWNRMKGKHVMWLPGTDHAGIATQAVVEKKIWRERKQTKHDLGRVAFLEEVWKWKNEKGGVILNQLRRLGASVDHSRTVFTMDEARSKCVTEAFVKMFEDGLIYRDTRLVNWSHSLNTALSDIEVDSEEIKGFSMRAVKGHDPKKLYEFGTLSSFAYKVVGSEQEIVVATTRLETMLGDTAVAINSKDPRYTHLHGRRVAHPFRAGATLPIVLDDELVDMSFGTGAVKITPAHDPNDFKCGRRHGLEEISILNDDGSINDVCGPRFRGVMRYDARVLIEGELKKLGLWRGKQGHDMVLPICSRSGDIIEPRLKPQWWVNTQSMAAESVAKVRSGELKLVPDFHEATWYRWLENTQDWCISRQLWWGHRIPAFKVAGQVPEKWYVARDEAAARRQAARELGRAEAQLTMDQDPDVLDTWFSSGLFPFASFGWAHADAASQDELAAFFPGTLLETGHDILFFWVARMVMMSLHLTKQLPFTTVYLHAMVRDKYGRKMSKSLGNVLDPIQVMEGITLKELHDSLLGGNLPEAELEKAREGQKLDYPEGIPECGADALRFGLLAYTQQGRDVNLDINRVAAYRRFCNKLWQVTNFMLLNMGDGFTPDADFVQRSAASHEGLEMRDRWLLGRLAQCAADCNRAMESYEFAGVTTALTRFILDELCDVYVEASKPVMYRGSEQQKRASQNTLWAALDVALRLMHPVMPFVTEELWQRLPGREKVMARYESIMVAPYPGAAPVARLAHDDQAARDAKALNALGDPEADEYFSLANKVAAGMRSLVASFNIQSGRNIDFYIKVAGDDSKQRLLDLASSDLAVLARVKEVTVLRDGASPPEGCAAGLPDPNVQIFLQLQGLLNPAEELLKIQAELLKAQASLDQLKDKKTSNFYDRMAESAKDKLEQDIATGEAKVATLLEQQALFAKHV